MYFDLVFAIFLLVLFLPLFLILGILVKVDSKGPIFYKALRVGKYGKLFKMWKFRTMVDHAEHLGPAVTSRDDIRITKTGKILRRLKIDELPSLFNVLLGDMNIVGPRPESPQWVVTLKF